MHVHREDRQHHLPHQGLWFVFMLTLLWMLLSEMVGGALLLAGSLA